MYEPNVELLLGQLEPSDRVLDVGGWACPFNRAQWILDAEPWETRGFYRTFGGPPSQGGEREHFSRETWVQRDICGRQPWPFADKEFDFVICSHTLEDVRDPLWVCSELVRVGKRGYLETPSRLLESCRGLEAPGVVGLSHHRWFVEMEPGHVRFMMKFHFVHSEFRFGFPASHAARLSPEERIAALWWEDKFEATERVIHGLDRQRKEIADYVSSVRPYPRWRFRLAGVHALTARLLRSVRQRLRTTRKRDG